MPIIDVELMEIETDPVKNCERLWQKYDEYDRVLGYDWYTDGDETIHALLERCILAHLILYSQTAHGKIAASAIL